jgi:uncharacterized membrane protein YeaQ/YmgE (transglycosylase-associated protein family)
MIGLHFEPFLVLLVLSLIAALIVHYAFRYRFLEGFDGFLWKWVIGWIGAWLGTPVLGDWFDGVKIANIYIIPALLPAFAGAFVATAIWKADAKALNHKAT